MATSVNAEALNESPIPEAVSNTGKQLIDPYNVSGEVAEDGTMKAIDYKSNYPVPKCAQRLWLTRGP